MIGQCLCGSVKFEIKTKKIKIYQCHCSLCRKQTGTASSCGSIVQSEQFSWLRGEVNITTWQKDSGFTSHFCSTCGSSVPNLFRDRPFFWVPAGLIDNGDIELAANIFVCDIAKWSSVSTGINPYQTRPELEGLIALLNETTAKIL